MIANAGVCPFCGERILASAERCSHCSEHLRPPTRESVFQDQLSEEQIPAGQVDDLVIGYLRGVELRGAYLSGADLFHADLIGADLRGADLGEANLSTADLSRADLRRANLRGADLSDANLSGADLGGANLLDADLDRAIYDNATVWPDDYDPKSGGAINRAE
jgi:uncharacterized protein YjbI with pentapeptide repeats